jgi:hypothetical protein
MLSMILLKCGVQFVTDQSTAFRRNLISPLLHLFHQEYASTNSPVMFFLMLCWPCTSIYACNETNLMHYLSSVYSITIPLHVSGLLVAHHQEVAMYICDSWYVLSFLVDCQLAWMARRQSTKTYNTYHLSHTSWWWATSKSETCRGLVTE